MRRAIFLCALLTTACSQSQPPGLTQANKSSPQISQSNAQAGSSNVGARGSLSPSAPINLNYQVESAVSGQPQRIDLVINTRLTSGTLLVEIAKQEGAEAIAAATQRIDLASVARPISTHIEAIQLGNGEHFLVLLLTVETDMGPMSRSFRIDLIPASTDSQ